MKKDRRSFIGLSGMAAGTALMSGVSAQQAVSAAAAPEEQAEQLVTRFAKVVRHEKTKDGTVQIVISRIDHSRMALLLSDQKRLPFDDIRVNPGGDLEIRRGEHRVRIVRLT